MYSIHLLGRFWRLVGIVGLLASCSPATTSPSEPEVQSEPKVELAKLASEPMPPEKAQEMLKDVGTNWFYGQGLGETAIAAGASIMFPPYLIYVLGNGILSLSGYEQIRVTDALPEDARASWNSVYDEVSSGPGRLTSTVAGREFVTKDMARENLESYLHSE